MKNYPNITQQKTAEINRLKNKVIDSTKQKEVAQAAFQAAVEKSELCQRLLTDAQARLVTATQEFDLGAKANQNLLSTMTSDEEANANACQTREQIDQLIAQVQAVVTTTITASSAIVETSRIITDRKASNPLISSDLVTRAQEAVTQSNRVVTLIINTLVSVTNALSAAGQAVDTVKIVSQEILNLKRIIQPSKRPLSDVPPILNKVNIQYERARKTENKAQKGAKQARDQQLGAQSRLTVATNELQKDQAALAAAKAAIGSN